MESAYKLWNRVFSDKYLRELYEKKIHNKSSIGLDWITPEKFSEQIDDEISIILRKTNNCRYHFTRYRELLISKGAEKPPRSISIPTIRDKLVFSALNEVLVGTYGKNVVAPMPQVVIEQIRNVLSQGQFNYFIKLDIKSFYASINHEQLVKILRRRIRKPQITALIENAIKTPTIAPSSLGNTKEREVGLPEGIAISNTLANLYLSSIDEKYCTDGTQYKYWRYVDDILILTTEENYEKVYSEIICDIESLNLTVEKEKTKYGPITQGFEYLGYYLNEQSITVRKNSIVKMERSLETVFRNYRSSKSKNIDYLKWRINLKVTGFVFENRKYGWVFFYSQINDLQCLFHLDWVIGKLSKRYGLKNVNFKKFIRTFKEIENALHETTYIPNLDNMCIDEKRKIIKDIYGQNIEGKEDASIEHRFHWIMTREMRDIQKDVQSFS